MNNKSLPPFFNYVEETTDNGYESIQDFYLSWAIRCADEKYSEVGEKVHLYSKQITSALLFGSNGNTLKDGFTFTALKNSTPPSKILDVKTLRQKPDHNDLVAEIKIERDNKVENWILNIENKWYTPVKPHQLKKSRMAVERSYNSASDNGTIRNLLIYVDYEKLNDELFERAKAEKYTLLTIADLQDICGFGDKKPKTGNALFDAFWFWLNTTNNV